MGQGPARVNSRGWRPAPGMAPANFSNLPCRRSGAAIGPERARSGYDVTYACRRQAFCSVTVDCSRRKMPGRWAQVFDYVRRDARIRYIYSIAQILRIGTVINPIAGEIRQCRAVGVLDGGYPVQSDGPAGYGDNVNGEKWEAGPRFAITHRDFDRLIASDVGTRRCAVECPGGRVEVCPCRFVFDREIQRIAICVTGIRDEVIEGLLQHRVRR